jgi:hypothetical protein
MITLREGVYKAKNHRIYNWMKTKKIIFGFVQERVTPIYMAYLIGKITINQEILSLPTVRQTQRFRIWNILFLITNTMWGYRHFF